MPNSVTRPPRFSTSKDKAEVIGSKLEEVKKFRSGSGYGLDAETINNKIATMASTFKEGFGAKLIEDFSINELRGVLGAVLDLQRELKHMTVRTEKLVEKFAPIRVYLDNVSTDYQSDGLEPMDLEDEVPGGKNHK